MYEQFFTFLQTYIIISYCDLVVNFENQSRTKTVDVLSTGKVYMLTTYVIRSAQVVSIEEPMSLGLLEF